MKRPKETVKKLRSLKARNATKSSRTIKGGAIMKSKHDTANTPINNIK